MNGSFLTTDAPSSISHIVHLPGFGAVRFRPLDLDRDIPLLHDWVNREYARFWGLHNTTLDDVRREYTRLTQPDHYDVFIGEFNGTASFLLERYDPRQDMVGQHYAVQEGDCGIHIIVAPTEKPIRGFTWHIFRAILAFVFTDPRVQRVIIEPDVRNDKMHRLSKRVGFVYTDTLRLPHKTAYLAGYRREQYHATSLLTSLPTDNPMPTPETLTPQQAVAHLEPARWITVNTLLIRKALCEFAHELLITPLLLHEQDGWGYYRLQADTEGIVYTFRAQPLALNHLHIDTASIEKHHHGKKVTPDAVLFIHEFKTSLGIDVKMLPVYLEEIISTLYGSAYKHAKGALTAQELVHADFQQIEAAMTEGHPGFVANNGRIGFDASDYRAYTPETGNTFRLVWLAGHKDRTVYAGTDDLPYATLMGQELDGATIQTFQQVLRDKGLDPAAYLFIPVHPWQWFNKLANVFAPEIATNHVVCLGYGPDAYQAQQSIRTLFNTTDPRKFYTKTSLSILNMGFMRGLPLYYLGSAPEMAEWLEQLLYADPYIQETGFTMLGEIASISYVNPYFETFGKHNGYNKMIASLWRQSPWSVLKPGQRVMTMASLLHVDPYGSALLPAVIEASGLTIDDWLDAYLKAYLSPLLHCFYRYDLVFMPHGENIILVMEDHIPVRGLLKDITEEACILNPDIALPENINRMYAEVPDDVKLLSIFTDIFDGFFRYMAHVLVEHAQYDEKRFWERVAACVHHYQQRYPEMEDKFRYYDMFAADFQLSCLNRLQLNNNQQMIDLDNPVALLQFAGRLKNPIAAFKKVLSDTHVI